MFNVCIFYTVVIELLSSMLESSLSSSESSSETEDTFDVFVYDLPLFEVLDTVLLDYEVPWVFWTSRIEGVSFF